MDSKNLTEEEMQEIYRAMQRKYHAQWRSKNHDKCKAYWTAGNAKRNAAKKEQSHRNDAA